MLQEYWPNERQIQCCIRTEAEELSPYVLQAIHEPMRLRKLNINTGDSSYISENSEEELLNHLKIHNRPIPILGDAGSGKSHLIRLLDVQLHNDPETKDWIVKRIPKSSSLRRVLEILLDGMEGDSFDKLRTRITDVGKKLKTQNVADYLILFMGHRLEELLEETNKKVNEIKASGGTVSEEQKAELRLIKQHAPMNKLPSLLSDPNFKENLIKPNCCLYNIAKRITSGSSSNEIIEDEYEIKESDLDFSTLNINNFSNNAQRYISHQQLNTNIDKRREVVDLLNSILSDSCRTAFQQFFQFNSGQFQELFSDIRKELLGKTLVILVEDMAAITAVENDLIDSLLLEGTRDGKQTLCTVKSAIAVTTGYEGYQRRRNTIATRSGAIEWHIEKHDDSQGIYQRVQNFCGRYLNASRYPIPDNADVSEKIKEEISSKRFPLETWHDIKLDRDTLDDLKSFDESDNGYPLFPYNRQALKALTDKYCRNTLGELEFNPRTILSHILIPILRDYREKFSKGTFPPAHFLDLSFSTNLQNQLRINDSSKLEQSFAAISFWGYQATNKNNLVSLMPPAIASHMGLNELAAILGNTSAEPIETTIPTASIVEATTPKSDPRSGSKPIPSTSEKDISDIVDEAFKRKFIDQKLASVIRAELLEILKNEFKYSQKWNSVNFNISDFIKPNRRDYCIEITYNSNHPDKTYVKFGDEKEFSDQIKSLKYRQFIAAILKRNKNNDWDETLYDDFCRYQSFAKDWADEVIPSIISQIQSESILDALKPSVEMACTIHPSFTSSTNEERLNILCSHSDHWREGLTSQTGYADWDNYKNELIKEWDQKRKEWIKYVSHNDHAISRDIASKFLKKIDTKTISNSIAQKTHREILSTYQGLYSILDGCSNRDDFIHAFESMLRLVKRMKETDNYSKLESDITAVKLINRINKVIDSEHTPTYWKSVSKLLKILGPFSLESFIKNSNQFNSTDLIPVSDLLTIWNDLYSTNHSRYTTINKANNSESRSRIESEIVNKVCMTKKQVEALLSEKEAVENEVS
jgi:hypothetical protein